MSLTKTNIFYGPFNFVGSGGTGFTRDGLLPDSVAWGVETKRGNQVLEDGTENNWEAGRILTLEITFSETLPADQTLIEALTSAVITFTKSNKVMTIAAASAGTSTLKCFADVVDGKTKITIIKTSKVGSEMSDLYSLT